MQKNNKNLHFGEKPRVHHICFCRVRDVKPDVCWTAAPCRPGGVSSVSSMLSSMTRRGGYKAATISTSLTLEMYNQRDKSEKLQYIILELLNHNILFSKYVFFILQYKSHSAQFLSPHQLFPGITSMLVCNFHKIIAK